MPFAAIDPATGETLSEHPSLTAEEARRAVTRAHEAFLEWRARSVAERCAPLRAAAGLLHQRRDDYARLIAREMGKVLAEARAEVKKCALGCEFYAEHAASYLAAEPVETGARRSYVAFEPLGVILAIMPWNFPFWQVFRFAAPALAAGNVALLKHAPSVPGCAMAIEELLGDAGFPPNVFRSIFAEVELVPSIIEHPLVRGVTLTGSTRAGRAVAGLAGASLKKTVLELGGSDPYIVLEDADLEAAVSMCAASRLMNAGQSCIAAKRFIVVRSRAEDFQERLVERMAAVRVGDPMDEATDIGPLARLDLRDQLHRQVLESVGRGARLLLGGEVPDGPGAFYPPTVLADVGPGMPAYDEELFGPVASIITADDEADAVRVANDTVYGLGAAVFTSDPERGERVARLLEAGSTFVNAQVRSDPRLPFGGVKDSGYGRELSRYGLREFTNIKTVYVG